METITTEDKVGLEEVIIYMAVAVHLALGEGEKVKEAEEGIKMEVVTGKEDSEEMSNIITEDKVGLDRVKIKENQEGLGLEVDKEMEGVEGLEMAINQGNLSIHLIRME